MEHPEKKPIYDTIGAGFGIVVKENYFVRDDLQDRFFYAGKNRPELYFNETIRRGISSFAAFANAEEVECGLVELKADVESGAWRNVREQYENDRGDYLFMVAEKKTQNFAGNFASSAS